MRLNWSKVLGASPNALVWLIASVVFCHFLVLSEKALSEEFNPDDTTNMYLSWIKTDAHLIYTSTIGLWEGEVRPVGLLFYRMVHKGFGFNTLPFRVACFAFLLANLALQFKVHLRVFPKVEFAVLALLVVCFHGALWSIYASTGTIFDILCQFFLLLALNSYICYLERRCAWLLGLTYLWSILAIQSKEMGYAVPVLLLCYDACYTIPAWRRPYWPSIRHALFRVAPVVGAAFVGIGGMLLGSTVIFRSAGYTPHLTWTTYVETNAAHLTMLCYREWTVTPATGLLILGGTLLLAAVLRSRAAVFGWLFYNAALLPISFVDARSDGYVLYTAYTGCAIYVAGVVEACAERMALRSPVSVRRRMTVAAALLFAALVVQVQKVQAAGCIRRGFGPGGQSLVGDLAATARSPGAAGKKRVILVDDPFGGDYWQPLFILRLSRNDITLGLARSTSEQIKVGQAPEVRPGDQILVYSDHAYREIPPDTLRAMSNVSTGG
ncbi:MAG: hypothetical protein M1541_01740 [Acidobacteria bacterium]|nr:hypothetical protein [Acidobacteriota bacterium]